VLFDMPFTASPPRLANPDLGLAKVVALAGRDESHVAEVTLLDVADHRLIRSGVELAHRVIDGRGDWYLRAPAWNPLLPTEKVQPFAHGDLPDDLADLVMPFRRRATLGPVAAISYERHAFEIRGPSDHDGDDHEGDDHDGDDHEGDDDHPNDHLGRLLDVRVTIRRGGVTTARFREIRLMPGPTPLSAAQLDWLTRALMSAGGTVVDEFPSLATRLGTPATGLTDYPAPRPVDAGSSFENFVESVFAGHLRGLIAADMAARAGELTATDRLTKIAGTLGAELKALAPTMGQDWLTDLDEELGWLQSTLAEGGEDVERVRSTLRRERYLRLLDLLVTGVRGPRVDENLADRSSADILGELLDGAVERLLAAADRLSPDAADEEWAAAATVAEEIRRIDRLSRDVLPKRARRKAKRLRPVIKELITIRGASVAATEAQRQSRFATPPDAFDLGRAYERDRQRQFAAQDAFGKSWAGVSRKLGR
jgi:hypothetical protein